MDIYHITVHYNVFKRTTLGDQPEEIDYTDNCVVIQWNTI